MTDIVDALVNCRLVQTDKVQDQLIHFRLIQVIQAMCSSGSAYCLTDEALWNVIEHCYLTALQVSWRSLKQLGDVVRSAHLSFCVAAAE